MRDDEPRPVWMSLPITHYTRVNHTQGRVCVLNKSCTIREFGVVHCRYKLVPAKSCPWRSGSYWRTGIGVGGVSKRLCAICRSYLRYPRSLNWG